MDTFAQALQKLLQPMFYADAQNGNSLRTFTQGLGDLFQLIEEYASDTDEQNSKPGYSLWVDLDRAPDEVLPWLGQFVGVTVTTGISPADQKTQIRELGVWGRGTPAAMIAAAETTLTGTKTVIFRERWNGSAYRISVTVKTSETPNSAATLAALLAQKPGGIVMEFNVIAGQDYAQLLASDPLYSNVLANYDDYAAVNADQPG